MLIDFAADVRAPTPTGAAEMVVPTKLALVQELDNMWVRISTTFITRLNNAKQRIESINIKSPKQIVMENAQRLDDMGRTLNILIDGKMNIARGSMDTVARFPVILQNRMETLSNTIMHMGQMLQSLSYKSVLSRGYAIVRDANNNIIARAGAGTPATIEFADGVIQI